MVNLTQSTGLREEVGVVSPKKFIIFLPEGGEVDAGQEKTGILERTTLTIYHTLNFHTQNSLNGENSRSEFFLS